MSNKREAITKIGEMIDDIKVAMLTTIDEHGHLHGRPMMTQQHQFDGDVWFFADRTSDKVSEIERTPAVNVAYVEDSNYVSLAGRAEIVSDMTKKKALWHDALNLWFENGVEAPEVVLIHVKALTAQYWDGADGPLEKAAGLVKLVLTGDEEALGETNTVQY